MVGQGWDHNDIRGARVCTVAPATATALWHLLCCGRQCHRHLDPQPAFAHDRDRELRLWTVTSELLSKAGA